MAAVCLVMIFPVFWTVSGSFKTTDMFYRDTPIWFPKPTLVHFWSAVEMSRMGLPFVNSLIVSASTVCVTLFTGSMAAYSLARYRFPGSRALPYVFLFFRMVPHVVLLFPMFMLLNAYRLLDTRTGLVVVYVSFTLPFAVWVMIGFFRDLPRDLEDAATIDGCSMVKTFLFIFIPLVAPAFAAVGILNWSYSWNEFLYSTVLTRGNALTLPPAMSKLFQDHRVHWPELCAMASVIIVPVIVVATLMQRFIVRGLTQGAVK